MAAKRPDTPLAATFVAPFIAPFTAPFTAALAIVFFAPFGAINLDDIGKFGVFFIIISFFGFSLPLGRS